ncbi:helix-turn-helix domain-containing protein [Natronolimnohabitans innermongolicus]|uniref:Bacterio-opsin activator HTH domain-containing protein n=1 Tax=Natronolimnohabitans innermongolicus JCM 12255 TaxID=1227499 RepID=L9XK39_9EURY|nr:helix-turn-helix domain-containing protein [Natronolimnohabitans innermongolicus]ELY62139.1 bacterio-opsin activator HTH domain-containing protein [Natronolimnohabitans innermongolicus JCM 12255]
MLIVEYRVDSAVLMETLGSLSSVTIHIEEQYLTADGRIRVYFWAERAETDAVGETDTTDTDTWSRFETALAGDPTVSEAKPLTDATQRRLYRITLTDEGQSETTFPRWAELDLVLLESVGTADGWANRVRIPDRETLEQYRTALRECGLEFRLQSLYRESDAASTAEAQLTGEQYVALVAAYDAGYFDVPRTTSQSELASKLSISSQALSERLRRGTATLIEETLLRNPAPI